MLIEEEETEKHSDLNPSKPSSSTNRNASDGFETASDGELGSNGSDNDAKPNNKRNSKVSLRLTTSH
ncbi:tetratricopeptide repeat protein 1-like [Prunus yedoensis var. nudiflora]|uniref:Tetratricopeptide repeat protein 1-like n=1 Tax=Prunus yedoensis var. nudiflora TaxID=2094558 RepID=A0A314Z8G3_PRUYE|nr:tetratricopeptide repeat protein 1-like [Prunus yedoensis var. nudiflora]